VVYQLPYRHQGRVCGDLVFWFIEFEIQGSESPASVRLRTVLFYRSEDQLALHSLTPCIRFSPSEDPDGGTSSALFSLETSRLKASPREHDGSFVHAGMLAGLILPEVSSQ
jgi:hypothetical protein